MRNSYKIHGSEIKKMKVAIKKLDEKAIVPSYGSEYAAGADLYACLSGDLVIPPHKTVLIPTGIAIELPLGYAGLIYARSGLATKKGLAPANKVGVVDCDYRGEVKVALHNHSEEEQSVCAGERIAQLVITPYLTAEFSVGEELSQTERGDGGFGSTGSK
jgi:dUTP pyrophosphatase